MITCSNSKKLLNNLKNNMGSKPMTEKEAIITIAYYNDWRQGKDEDAPMVKPEHVTEAIRVVIQKWKENNEQQ